MTDDLKPLDDKAEERKELTVKYLVSQDMLDTLDAGCSIWVENGKAEGIAEAEIFPRFVLGIALEWTQQYLERERAALDQGPMN